MSWFFELDNEKLYVCVDGDERAEVVALRIGKKFSFVELLLCDDKLLSLSVDLFDNQGSVICRSMTPLKRSKVEPFCISRTKFVERWCKFVSVWPEGASAQDDQLEQSELSSSDDSDAGNVDVQKTVKQSVMGKSETGIQDEILNRKFIGTYDVHIKNLIAPHSSRSTRLLNHEHVGVLSDSFQENNLGQFVILVGMLTSERTDPAQLRNDGCCEVEVLGGNHTRQALQSLHEKGTLTNPLVKVNVYRPLPVTAALAIGYQHNTLLQEKRRPLQFIEKVRLMRYCRPSETMSKDEVAHWKDMLVVIFRTKDRRKLMACYMYQQHMLMAKLPECLWKKVCLAIERTGPVNEKFFRPLMRIKDEAVIDKCLETLITVGQKEYKDMVKEYINKGCVRSKKAAQERLVPVGECLIETEEPEEKSEPDHYKEMYLSLKNDHESLQNEIERLRSENSSLKEKLKKLSSGTVEKESRASSKRPSESVLEEISKGQIIEALWKDENGEEWLEATVLRVGKKVVKVQYTVDNGIASVPISWVRQQDQA